MIQDESPLEELDDHRDIEQEKGTPLGEGVDCVYLSVPNESWFWSFYVKRLAMA